MDDDRAEPVAVSPVRAGPRGEEEALDEDLQRAIQESLRMEEERKARGTVVFRI